MYKAFVVKAPGKLYSESNNNSLYTSRVLGTLFLAGSIEMGKAEDWQTKVSTDLQSSHIRILNPRRDDWDSSWEQKADNSKFFEQVNWEQEAIHISDVISVYFAPGTMSPITLLELGTLLGTDPEKLVVYCPAEYQRKGNVDITCARFGVPVHTNYDTWLTAIKTKLKLI